MTEYENLIDSFENAEEVIKSIVGNSIYNQIVSIVKSSNIDLVLALNFAANYLNKEFASDEEYVGFLNRLMPELAGDRVTLAYICGMLAAQWNIQNMD